MTPTAYSPRQRQRIITREARMKELGHESYNAYLRSAEWAKVKAHFRKLVIEACGLCGSEDSLHLHHMTYERVGEELPTDLVWLCSGCHRMVHVLEVRRELGLDFDGLADFERAAKYAAEQSSRRDEAERDIQDARFAPDRAEWHLNNICQQLKQRTKELPPERAAALIDDVNEIVNDFAKAARDGVAYVPKYH